MEEDDKAKPSPSQKTLRKIEIGLAVGIAAIEMCVAITIFVILALYDGNCDYPIRRWLFILAIAVGAHAVLILLLQPIILSFAGTLKSAARNSFYGLNILYYLALIIWAILGSVWEYKADCEEFVEGYLLTEIILILAYCVLGLISLVACVLGCCYCVGKGLTERGSTYYQPI